MDKVTWNYRVVKDRDGELTLRTAFYYGKTLNSIGKQPAFAVGGSKEDLKSDLLKMMEALKKPVLKDEDF